MAACQITIEFDRSDKTYCSGETVRGQVHVQALQDLTSNGVTLTQFWKTHGTGTPDTGPETGQTLGQPGVMAAGETRSYDFAFVPEPVPLTYEGHLIFIDHFVRVDVDIAWGSDGKLEQPFNLEPGRLTGQEPDEQRELEIKPESSPVLAGLILLLSTGCLLMTLYETWQYLVPAILVVCAGLLVQKTMLFYRLGEVQLKTPDLTVHSGERWPVRLQFKPPKDLRINGLQVTVCCVETARSGGGEHRTTKTNTVYEEVHDIQRAGRLSGGRAFRKTLKLPFPDSKAFSFEGRNNTVVWTVEFHLDLPGFPDWKQTETVQFLPAREQPVPKKSRTQPDP